MGGRAILTVRAADRVPALAAGTVQEGRPEPGSGTTPGIARSQAALQGASSSQEKREKGPCWNALGIRTCFVLTIVTSTACGACAALVAGPPMQLLRECAHPPLQQSYDQFVRSGRPRHALDSVQTCTSEPSLQQIMCFCGWCIGACQLVSVRLALECSSYLVPCVPSNSAWVRPCSCAQSPRAPVFFRELAGPGLNRRSAAAV